MLVAIQNLRCPQGVHRRERLVVLLRPSKSAHQEHATGEPPGDVGGSMMRVRGVDRGGCAVLPILGEEVAAGVDSPAAIGLIPGRHDARAVSRSEVRVNRTARRNPWILLLRNGN